MTSSKTQVRGKRTRLALVKTPKVRRKAKRTKRKSRPAIVSNCEQCGEQLKVWRNRTSGSFSCACGAGFDYAKMVDGAPRFFCSQECCELFVASQQPKPEPKEETCSVARGKSVNSYSELPSQS